MKQRRDIASTPQRSAKATWTEIIALVTSNGSIDVDQLEAARSVMEGLIADEAVMSDPIIIGGCGPRLVIYLAYDRDALELGDAVDRLSWNPTSGDWWLSAPAPADDVAWMRASLSTTAPRIRIRAPGEVVQEDTNKSANTQALAIDWSVLG